MKQTLPTLAVLSLMGASIGGCPNPPSATVTDVSVQQARDLWVAGVFVLDVRTTGEYDGGHIPGAYNLNVADLQDRLDELAGKENDDILVYCGVGGRSASASAQLVEAGFTGIHNMLGGFAAWQDAGYEAEPPA